MEEPISTGVTPKPLRVVSDFWESPTLEELFRRQGVKPITDFSTLASDAWDDVDIDEFLATVRRWRDEG